MRVFERIMSGLLLSGGDGGGELGHRVGPPLYSGCPASSWPFAGRRFARRIERLVLRLELTLKSGLGYVSRSPPSNFVRSCGFPHRTIPVRIRVALVVGSARAGGGGRAHLAKEGVRLDRRSGHEDRPFLARGQLRSFRSQSGTSTPGIDFVTRTAPGSCHLGEVSFRRCLLFYPISLFLSRAGTLWGI